MWRGAIVDRAPGGSPGMGRPTSGRFHSEGQSLSTPRPEQRGACHKKQGPHARTGKGTGVTGSTGRLRDGGDR